jgi:hypothetical protein
MNFDVVDVGVGKTRIRRYLESHDWWVIPRVSEAASDLMGRVEQTYYMGDANSDFEIVVTGGATVLCVAFAHKRRMTAAQASELLTHFTGRPVEEAALGAQDVMAPWYAVEREDATLRMRLWAREMDEWLAEGRGEGQDR